MKKMFLGIFILLFSAIGIRSGLTQNEEISERLRGRILLQTESKGEAWYVDPVSDGRYYLGRPKDAFEVMKQVGLGISNSTFESFVSGLAPARLAGRILLKIEDKGKAFYVNPLDLRLHFLGKPSDAFDIMRGLGLGISNSDLNRIRKITDVQPGQDSVSGDVSLQLIAQDLSAPVALTSAKDGTGRLFVADQSGVIRIIDANNNLLSEPFLDLRDRMVTLKTEYDERGLLGLAFHPDYRNNGRIFVYYSTNLRAGAPAGWDHTSRISEFKVSENNSNTANKDSEKIILEVDQPQSNHNAGQIAFGPDKMLYIPLGDGGNANDVGLGHVSGGNAQDINSLLGKILRIDVDSEEAYSSPDDNPFVGIDGRDEIYAYGFRNPFHISFDAGGANDLIAGDAGQNQWEEIDLIVKGGNYGWNIKEGRHCFDANNPNVSPETCDTQGKNLIDPVLEYKNIRQSGGLGAVVVGGYIYRGSALANMQGKYIFGDWSTGFSGGDGTLFAADPNNSNWSFRELKIANGSNNRLGAYLLGFGEDDNKELYVLTSGNKAPLGTTGKIYKIIPASSSASPISTSPSTSTSTPGSTSTSTPDFMTAPTSTATSSATSTPTSTSTSGTSSTY